MSGIKRMINRFAYHLEDLDCRNCQFFQKKSRGHKHGCGEEICRFEDIRQEAIAKGRIQRKPGWFKCRE